MDTTIEILKTKGIIRGQVLSYQSIVSVRSACYNHSVRPTRIVLGEEGWYWLATPADASRLVKAGYEQIV